MQESNPQVGGVLGAVAVLLLALAWWMSRRRMRIVDVPRSRCAAMFVGFNQLEGTVRAVELSSTHFTNTTAAWWRATLEQEFRYERTVTSTDSKGRTTTRVEVDFRFEEVERWASNTVLWVADETGRALIDVASASVEVPAGHCEITGDRAWMVGTGLAASGVLGALAQGLAHANGTPTGRWRETEWWLTEGTTVFCVGTARIDDTGAGLVMAGGDGEFLVTTTTKDRVQGRRRFGVWFLLAAALAAAMFGASAAGAKAVGVAGAAAAVVGVVTAWGTVMLYNRLCRVSNFQERARSLIDIQLARRAVLIPQLVNVAKGAAAHERLTQTEVAAMRASTPAEVSMLAERYPTLVADPVFAKLFTELTDTETRLAAAREYFNDCVTIVRDRLRTFPGVLLVSLARDGRFGSRDLIEAGAEDRVVPSVAGLSAP